MSNSIKREIFATFRTKVMGQVYLKLCNEIIKLVFGELVIYGQTSLFRII